MKIDKTNGNGAKYLVGIYYGLIDDHYYFGSYADANNFYKKFIAKASGEGWHISVSLYDMKRDIRKAFWKN